MLLRQIYFTATLVTACLISHVLFAQTPINSVPSPLQRSLKEVVAVLSEANSLSDKMAITKVRSEAASLLWAHDTEQARNVFINLWQWIDQQSDSNFDRDLARTEVIKRLMPRDQALANKLLMEVQGEKKIEDAPLREQISGKDTNLKRLNQLASELLEVDVSLSAKMLEQSLSVSVSPGALGALTRLREKDWALADNLAIRTIERLRTRPDFISLPSMFLLIDYIFPVKLNGEKLSPPTPTVHFGQMYFNAAYEILKRSLSDEIIASLKGESYTESDRSFRAAYQGQIAAVLALLATRFGPEHIKELTELAGKLAAQVPAATAPLLKFTLDRLRETPVEMRPSSDGIAVALAKGEIETAKVLMDGLADENVRKSLLPLIANAEFKSHLAKGKLAEALLFARKADDPNLRTYQYLQVAKGTYQKKEIEFSRFIIYEALSFLADASNNTIRIRLLFSLAAEAIQISPLDSVEILEESVKGINSLFTPPLEKSAQAIPLNQADSSQLIAGSEEFSQAFSAAGLANLESTLSIAQSIVDMPIRLTAKLKACEKVIAKYGAGIGSQSPKK